MRDLLYRTDDWLFERHPRTVELWWGRDQRIAHVDALGEPVFAGPGLVVEYDGGYFHRGYNKTRSDIEKTEALVNAGLLVARIREQSSAIRLHPFMEDDPRVLMVDVDAKRWRDEMPSAVRQILDWASVHADAQNAPVSGAVSVSDALPMLGMHVVVSGGMSGVLAEYSRNEMKELVERYGGKSSGSVSKTTSLLAKAEELGVKVLTPEEFAELVGAMKRRSAAWSS